MSAQRTERLLNLVIALLATRRWLTKEQIRKAVPQYEDCKTDTAFDRMFERDKDDLRELGVPLEMRVHPIFEDEIGYRVDADAYALPPITFTPTELSVLGLAARVWQEANLSGPASRGLVKLKALGVPIEVDGFAGLEPRVRTPEPTFAALYSATRDHTPVSFGYRKQGETTAATRRVEPWRMLSWHGRWYLHGYDTDRGDSRVFRLSRITGRVRRTGPEGSVEVPDGIDSRAAVRRVWGGGPSRRAVIELEPHHGQLLRRQAGATPEQARVEIEFSELDQLAGQVAALGSRARVVEPEDLRRAVIGLLEGAARVHARAPAARAQP